MIIMMGRWSFSDIPPPCQTDTNQDCVFPFSYKGLEYATCTTADNHGVPWCSTSTDHRGQYVNGRWGNCQETCQTGKFNYISMKNVIVYLFDLFQVVRQYQDQIQENYVYFLSSGMELSTESVLLTPTMGYFGVPHMWIILGTQHSGATVTWPHVQAAGQLQAPHVSFHSSTTM